MATQNGPPDPSLDPRHDAEILVADFVQDLREGRSEDAAELWSGYPGRGDLESRVAGVDDLRDRLPWLADRTFDELTVNAPIWPGHILPVTVTASTGPDQPVSAAAFMVDTGDGEPPIIERLASPAPTSTPPSGTPVAPGQDIRVPVTTPELVGSDVVAWFGGASVLASDVAAGQVTVPVSERLTRPIVLTVMVPTAEVPVAWAFWFPVAER